MVWCGLCALVTLVKLITVFSLYCGSLSAWLDFDKLNRQPIHSCFFLVLFNRCDTFDGDKIYRNVQSKLNAVGAIAVMATPDREEEEKKQTVKRNE